MSSQEFLAFEAGDVVVGATRLDNADDDHAGQGRLIQYDSQLRLKATCLVDDTTYVIAGLKFDPHGALWAFDYQAHKVLCFDAQGRRTPAPDLGARSYSNIQFARDGSMLLGEHLVGGDSRVKLKTKLHRSSVTGRFGDGHVFRFDRDGQLLAEYATDTHGGMGGFLGVTMTALSADERVLYYVSETGPRLMRYDLVEDRQLPDLVTHAEGGREMFFDIALHVSGSLLALRGNRLEEIDTTSGEVLATHALPGFGWAMLCTCADGDSILTTNFFTGEVLRYSLSQQSVLSKIEIGDARRSLAGVAEFAIA